MTSSVLFPLTGFSSNLTRRIWRQCRIAAAAMSLLGSPTRPLALPQSGTFPSQRSASKPRPTPTRYFPSMPLKHVHTEHAPAAIGPYSQGVVANGFLFTAGQIALDPATGQMSTGTVGEQTEIVMGNLAAVLREVGATWDDVVRATVYLHDMAAFPQVNEVYGRWLGEARPARSTVQVSALPRGALVEIDLIVAVG